MNPVSETVRLPSSVPCAPEPTVFEPEIRQSVGVPCLATRNDARISGTWQVPVRSTSMLSNPFSKGDGIDHFAVPNLLSIALGGEVEDVTIESKFSSAIHSNTLAATVAAPVWNPWGHADDPFDFDDQD